MIEQEDRTGPVWVGVQEVGNQWEGGGCGERVYEGKYSASTMYTYIKMER
jgi:hypothetical protein